MRQAARAPDFTAVELFFGVSNIAESISALLAKASGNRRSLLYDGSCE